MNKTKIEWCDYTWNPVTGCLHGCEYCYARKITNRFGGGEWPYPYGFDPTFHRYKLGDPETIKTPSRIFVSSMGDLFGEWVPDYWIKEVFDACKTAPQHTVCAQSWAMNLFKSTGGRGMIEQKRGTV